MSVTLTLPRPPQVGEVFSRVDLEFRGVDHSGPSYEGRVFLDNPGADPSTPRGEDEGYAGSFYVFGHGGCFGELGHCDLHEEPTDIYDRRPPHQLAPQFKTVTVTEAVRRLLETSGSESFQLTVVPVVYQEPEEGSDPLRFESVSLFVYEDPVAAGPSPEVIPAER